MHLYGPHSLEGWTSGAPVSMSTPPCNPSAVLKRRCKGEERDHYAFLTQGVRLLRHTCGIPISRDESPTESQPWRRIVASIASVQDLTSSLISVRLQRSSNRNSSCQRCKRGIQSDVVIHRAERLRISTSGPLFTTIRLGGNELMPFRIEAGTDRQG